MANLFLKDGAPKYNPYKKDISAVIFCPFLQNDVDVIFGNTETFVAAPIERGARSAQILPIIFIYRRAKIKVDVGFIANESLPSDKLIKLRCSRTSEIPNLDPVFAHCPAVVIAYFRCHRRFLARLIFVIFFIFRRKYILRRAVRFHQSHGYVGHCAVILTDQNMGIVRM